MGSRLFSLADVCQQLIEPPRCVSQRLPISVGSKLQHLIETARRSLELLEFFARDLLSGSLLDGPNQACDSLPDIASVGAVVFVIHGSAARVAPKDYHLRQSHSPPSGRKCLGHRLRAQTRELIAHSSRLVL